MRLFRPASLLVLLLICSKVATGQRLPALITYTDGAKWGYADTNGKVMIAPQWDEATFFRNGRAEVVFNTADPHRIRVHCMIDEQGQYVVPPALGWTGDWCGWALTGLNAMDSTGRMGMIDTAGRLLLPYRWDGDGLGSVFGGAADSFKLVRRGRKTGLIDRHGNWVVAPAWRQVEPLYGMAPFNLFCVQDTLESRNANNWGLVDRRNHLILPPRYDRITGLPSPAGDRFLLLTTLEESGQGQDKHPVWRQRLAALQNGRIRPLAVEASKIDKTYFELPRPGGYILFGNDSFRYGLMNSSRQILLPCCVQLLSGDTVVYQERKEAGSDSILVKVHRYNIRTMQDMVPPETFLLHRDPPSPKPVVNPWHATTPYSRPYLRHPLVGFVSGFYKDSFLIYVTEAGRTGSDGHTFYIASACTTSAVLARKGADTSLAARMAREKALRTRNNCYAVVIDSNFNYLVRPARNTVIRSWNPASGFAIAQEANRSYLFQPNILLDTAGTLLLRSDSLELVDGLRWKNRLFAFALKLPQSLIPGQRPEERRAPRRLFLIDTSGAPVKALAPFTVLSPEGYRELLRQLPGGTAAVADSSGRIGFLTPDGDTVLKALSFRFRIIRKTGDQWFLVRQDYTGAGQLLNAAGRPVLEERLNVVSVVQASASRFSSCDDPGDGAGIRGLFLVTVEEGSGKRTSFYIDWKGRSYLHKQKD